ncbi:MAG: hypothetical protein IJC74_00085 [Clostridia bacterium]|nr:hypothetical protein [Clostridia bacterium]
MFKKSITVLVVTMLLFSCISSYAMIPYYQSDSQNEAEVPYGLLEELGIVSIDEYKTLDTTVTKGMFLKYIIRMTAVNESTITPATKQIFTDVPADSEFASWAQYGYEKGIILGNGIGLAELENIITANDAAVMAVRAVGYQVNESLFAKAKSDVLSGINYNEKLTADNAMRIIWNTLNLNVMMKETDGFYVNDNLTVLNHLFKVYKLDGIVDDDTVININSGASSLKSNRISINGIVYETKDGAWAGLAGRRVNAYIREYDGINEVLFVNPVRNEIKILQVDTVALFENGKIELDNEKMLRISETAKTICNFERVYLNNGSYELPKDGTIILIDNNSDNVYDCILIFAPQYGIVAETDKKENTLYINKGEIRATYNLDEYENYEFYNFDGKKISLNEISAGCLVEIYTSADKSRIYIVGQKNTVEFSVLGLTESDDNKIAISSDGTELIISPCYEELNKTVLQPGSSYLLTLDSNGRIAFATEIDMGGMTYGYLFSYKYSGVLDQNVTLAIYNINDEMLALQTKEKITVKENETENVYTSEALLNKFKQEFTPSLIRYAVNEDNRISIIEYPSSDRFANGFRCVGTTGSATSGLLQYDARMRANVVGMIGGQIMLDNTKTKIICVPSDLSVDGNWGIMNVADVFVDSEYYQSLKGYGTNPDSMVADIVIMPDSKFVYNAGASLAPGIVSGFEERYDEKTQERYKAIRVFLDGSEQYLRIGENITTEYTTKNGDVIPIEIGDVIRITKDHNDHMIGLKLLFDESTRTCYGENDVATEHSDKGYGHKQRTNFGIPYKIVGNAMYMIKEGESEPSSDIFRTDIGPMYEFDSSRKNPIRVITANDIETLSNNALATNKIFIQLYYSKSLITVLYK